ncbi:hypothetical protein [uncultured Porphyromonas sp.]|uniref:hypothetical protein n=1 Tax=uncultured Porphyromonas sp. TaxID=159274 RepID=UPI002619F125|nr:hypothetical protein [uncultured Porphyromonas sp.]
MKYNLFLITATALLTMACHGIDCPKDYTPIELPEIAKVEVVVIEGHLHGTYRFHQTPDAKGQKYMKRFNRFLFEKASVGSIILSSTSQQRLYAVGGIGEYNPKINSDSELSKKIAIAYGFWVEYYDAKGNKITDKVLGGDHKKRLQNFFTISDNRAAFDGDKREVDKYKSSADFITCIYCDTDPLSARIQDHAKVIGPSNPVGYKGYLGFSVPRSECTLHITLCDLAPIGKLSNGRPYRFYQLPAQGEKLLELTIPVTIYAHGYEAVEHYTLGEMTESDMRFLRSIAHAYGITVEEALEENIIRLHDTTPHTDSGYWF